MEINVLGPVMLCQLLCSSFWAKTRLPVAVRLVRIHPIRLERLRTALHFRTLLIVCKACILLGPHSRLMGWPRKKSPIFLNFSWSQITYVSSVFGRNLTTGPYHKDRWISFNCMITNFLQTPLAPAVVKSITLHKSFQCIFNGVNKILSVVLQLTFGKRHREYIIQKVFETFTGNYTFLPWSDLFSITTQKSLPADDSPQLPTSLIRKKPSIDFPKTWKWALMSCFFLIGRLQNDNE